MGALPLLAVEGDVAPRAALYALNRLGFGPRPGDVRRVLEQGLERYIESQLDPEPDPGLTAPLSGLANLRLSTQQILAAYAADNRSIGPIVDNFYAAKLIRAVHSTNQLEEVLADFWFNHFNVNINDGFVRYSIMSYERDAIRPNVFGKFRKLLGATAEHPAMLFYLDNYLSTVSRVVNGVLRQGLNENYGRELLELHSVGVDAGYSQEDVFEAARCFTGWGIDNTGSSGQFMYRSANHDTGAKSVFGLSVAAGGQKSDGDRLLDYLAVHPSTARFVSTKLARRFVADDPPQSLVEKMADTWLRTDGDISQVLRRMIGSAEFWAPAFDGTAKPKKPFEFVVSAIRAVGGTVTSATRGLTGYLANLGETMYQCLPPTGYSNSGIDWLNASSQLYRMNFGLDIASNLVGGVTVDTRGLARGITDPRMLARAVSNDIFAGTVSRQTLDAAGRVDTRVTNPSMASRVVGLLLAAPEFQVR
jgi:uncharacterized protein (DUF1800 family)